MSSGSQKSLSLTQNAVVDMCEAPNNSIQKDKSFVVQVISLKDVESDPNKAEAKKLVIK